MFGLFCAAFVRWAVPHEWSEAEGTRVCDERGLVIDPPRRAVNARTTSVSELQLTYRLSAQSCDLSRLQGV